MKTEGTPAQKPTRSASSISVRPSGSRRGPGYTIFVPVAAAAYGIPHADAWNMGTMGSTTAAWPRLKTSR